MPVASDGSTRHTPSLVPVLPPPYSVTCARPRDLAALPAIERAAARLLEGRVPDSILDEATSIADLADLQATGRLWVALAGDVPVGFAIVILLDDGTPHLEEIDVHPDHGRRGLGASLVRAVCDWVVRSGYPGSTLTTFRDVAWNMPFYAKMGFSVVPLERVTAPVAAIVRHETARGLDPGRRVVMRWIGSPALTE